MTRLSFIGMFTLCLFIQSYANRILFKQIRSLKDVAETPSKNLESKDIIKLNQIDSPPERVLRLKMRKVLNI